MKYALVGHGKMGRAIEARAAARGHERVATFDRERPLGTGGDLAVAEVAFEFSAPAAAAGHVDALLARGVAVVCGTTGWDAEPALLSRARTSAGLIVAPNFSLGVNLFFRLVRDAAATLGAFELWDPWILEAHHRAKADAPSGTARRLARLVLEADPRLARVQEGALDGPPSGETLQVLSLRAGAEPGTHVVGFDGEHDRIVLEHAARGREGFALGAVLAAEWLLGRGGLHEFDEVVESLIARGRAGQGGGGSW